MVVPYKFPSLACTRVAPGLEPSVPWKLASTLKVCAAEAIAVRVQSRNRAATVLDSLLRLSARFRVNRELHECGLRFSAMAVLCAAILGIENLSREGERLESPACAAGGGLRRRKATLNRTDGQGAADQFESLAGTLPALDLGSSVGFGEESESLNPSYWTLKAEISSQPRRKAPRSGHFLCQTTPQAPS